MRVESPSTAPFSIHIANFHRLNAHTYNFFKSGTRFVIHSLRHVQKSFSGGSYGKESARNAGDLGLIPGLERSPEKGMATHSSVLARRIPWTEELGGLQSMG